MVPIQYVIERGERRKGRESGEGGGEGCMGDSQIDLETDRQTGKR
jgi:hypothetical protein